MAHYDGEDDADIDADDEGDENVSPMPLSSYAVPSQMPSLMTWTGGRTGDLEGLAERLLGLSVEDAEEEAREALSDAMDAATDADVLAVLLTVFKADREYAIHEEDTWDRPLEFCQRMCSICDRNFLSAGGQPRPDDFPARVVASVYAECGRSYALAGQVPAASELLQKALNVFGLIPEPSMEEVMEISACRASFGRVLVRSGQMKRAQDQFLQAMQLLADVPDSLELEIPALVTEYSETLAAAGDEAVASPALLDLIVQMVEQKFGEGSDEHFQALQDLSDACLRAGKPGLAAPMLILLSRQLRNYYQDYGRDAWAGAEMEEVETKAAHALEAAAMQHMQEADFEAAATMWSMAIRMRESLSAPVELLEEMRSSLVALQAAGTAPGASSSPEDSPGPDIWEPGQAADEPPAEAPDSWDEPGEAAEPVQQQPPKVRPSLSQPVQALRPGWSAPSDAWD